MWQAELHIVLEFDRVEGGRHCGEAALRLLKSWPQHGVQRSQNFSVCSVPSGLPAE